MKENIPTQMTLLHNKYTPKHKVRGEVTNVKQIFMQHFSITKTTTDVTLQAEIDM